MKKFTSNFPGIRALVVEDYIVNQELVKEMLEMMSCEVDIAEDGIEALRSYENNKYDIIFMDIQMPEMDGYDVTREIRKREGEAKHMPIIAITANALIGDREKCLNAGMDDYISKPIKGEQLEEMLKKFCG